MAIINAPMRIQKVDNSDAIGKDKRQGGLHFSFPVMGGEKWPILPADETIEVTIAQLPPELVLIVAEKLEDPTDVLSFAGTCRYIRSVLVSMARPCVKLRYPKSLETSYPEERHIVGRQLTLLSRVPRIFCGCTFQIHNENTRHAYSQPQMFLRDTLIQGLPHLFRPIANLISVKELQEPMNGTALETLAERAGHIEVVKYIRERI